MAETDDEAEAESAAGGTGGKGDADRTSALPLLCVWAFSPSDRLREQAIGAGGASSTFTGGALAAAHHTATKSEREHCHATRLAELSSLVGWVGFSEI